MEILQEVSFHLKNVLYIECIFFLSHYMVFYYGTTTKPHYYTYLKFSEPYKEEPLYEFLEFFFLGYWSHPWSYSNKSISLKTQQKTSITHSIAFTKSPYQMVAKVKTLLLLPQTLYFNKKVNWQTEVKSSIIDANNRLNGIFHSFDSFNNEFFPRNRFIDMFPSHFLLLQLILK